MLKYILCLDSLIPIKSRIYIYIYTHTLHVTAVDENLVNPKIQGKKKKGSRTYLFKDELKILFYFLKCL